MSTFGVTPPTRLDELRSKRMAFAARMAFEIGLLSSTVHHDNDHTPSELGPRLQLNNIRAKVFLCLNENK